MRPTLLEVFGLKFHAWPTMLALAFLVGTLLAVRHGERAKPPIIGNPQGGLWAFIGALVGAKVFWILQYSEPKLLWRAFFLWEGGLVYYGGLIGGALAAFAYITVHKLPIRRSADVCAIYLALGQAITRVGCFLNGCCWGIETDVPWALTFPKNSYAYKHQIEAGIIDHTAVHANPVHPTQLYMVIGLIAIFALLEVAYGRRHFDGAIALLYCFAYGILRFIVEFYRGDSARSVFGMTVSQVISLGLLILPVVVLALMRSGVLGSKGLDNDREAPAEESEAAHD